MKVGGGKKKCNNLEVDMFCTSSCQGSGSPPEKVLLGLEGIASGHVNGADTCWEREPKKLDHHNTSSDAQRMDHRGGEILSCFWFSKKDERKVKVTTVFLASVQYLGQLQLALCVLIQPIKGDQRE